LQIAELNLRMKDRRIAIELDGEARDWVAERGYDPVYGARPLRRFLQKRIENKLARALIAGEVNEGQTIDFILQDDELTMLLIPEPQVIVD
jgi:ATP-dependent Clp protease ATP-binding subunit ClpB